MTDITLAKHERPKCSRRVMSDWCRFRSNLEIAADSPDDAWCSAHRLQFIKVVRLKKTMSKRCLRKVMTDDPENQTNGQGRLFFQPHAHPRGCVCCSRDLTWSVSWTRAKSSPGIVDSKIIRTISMGQQAGTGSQLSKSYTTVSVEVITTVPPVPTGTLFPFIHRLSVATPSCEAQCPVYHL